MFMRGLVGVLMLVAAGCVPGDAPKVAGNAAAVAAKVTAVSPQRKSLARIVEQPGSVRATRRRRCTPG